MNLRQEEIVSAAEKLREKTARTLIDLIRIPSPSRGEGDVIRYIEQRMRDLRFDEVRVDPMGNLLGRLGEGERSIAFDAHADVVDVVDGDSWTWPPFEGHNDGRFIYGRGACDQKGAIASLLTAAELMKELSLAGGVTVYVIITVQEEECEGLCWCHLIAEEGLRPDAVLLTEPSALKISRGQKGKLQMIVETPGVGSHGSAPELGENAIYKMARIVLGIEELNGRLKAIPPVGKGTVAVSKIESRAASLCSVAEGCRIYLDRRLGHGETREKAIHEIEQIAGPQGGKVRVPRYEGVSYRGLARAREEYYPGWLISEKSALLGAALRTHRLLFKREGEVIIWDFSTNGIATCGLHGIPTIGFGPGDPRNAHVRDERVPLDHLVAASAFYAAFPSQYVSGGG